MAQRCFFEDGGRRFISLTPADEGGFWERPAVQNNFEHLAVVQFRLMVDWDSVVCSSHVDCPVGMVVKIGQHFGFLARTTVAQLYVGIEGTPIAPSQW